MKTLAIDPGSRRLGLAACDELEWTTRLLPVLPMDSLNHTIGALVDLIAREGFRRVVLGLPLNMDGSLGPAAQRSKELGRALGKEVSRRGLDCTVILWDERLTSFEAEQRIREKGIPKAKAKDYLDSLAAEVLLEDYLRKSKE